MNSLKRVGVLIMVVLVISGTVATAAPLKIGITWTGTSGLATMLADAFREKITELVPGVEIEFQNPPDVAALGEVIARFEQEKNGMVVLRGDGISWVVAHPPAIPTFVSLSDQPARYVKHPEAPEGNITGVVHSIPLDKQFDIFQALVPNMDAVLLLLAQGHPSTERNRTETQALCKQRSITYYEQVSATLEESIAAVKASRDKVKAVLIGNNALHADHAGDIVEAAGTTLVFGYSADTVKAGALGGFTANLTLLGHLLAESAVDVLVNGKAVKDVPFKMDPNPEFVVNVSTAKKLGIEIPYNILRAATIVE